MKNSTKANIFGSFMIIGLIDFASSVIMKTEGGIITGSLYSLHPVAGAYASIFFRSFFILWLILFFIYRKKSHGMDQVVSQ